MVRRRLIVLLLLLAGVTEVVPVAAQEVLLPLQRAAVFPQPAVKAQPEAVRLPFFDDFAGGTVSMSHWQSPSGAMATVNVSPLAPTVGVATLDALDALGQLYLQASTSIFPADTLLSLPIRLDSLSPTDSVVFSFHYLPGGGYGNMWERVGECPDLQDSLFLDFYRAADSTWVTVWCRGGISVDTLMAQTGSAWQYVVVPLADSAFFDSAFCFRFRNYASLESSPKVGRVGNGDYWHLDCIYLDRGRAVSAVPVARDVAFAAPAPSLLHTYRAMPYRQYTSAALAETLDMKIINRYSSPLATHYAYSVYDSLGNVLDSYDGGFENAPAQELQTIATHANPSVNVTFPVMTAATEYTVVHTVCEGTGGDAYPLNDTVRYRQYFGDYYAYDDGSSENGYGLTSTAARLYLAYRFDLTNPDTLTAVDLYFNTTLDAGNATIPFYLTLWSVGDDGRPAEVLYRDEQRRFAAFGGFVRYALEAPVEVDSAIFVGFEQTGNDYINLGFDRSLNTAERIWYLTGTEWQQSILSGSLMLRPAFGTAATMGVAEQRTERGAWRIYPNPATDRVYIDGEVDGVELYDRQGRRLMTTRGNALCVSALADGIYLLRILSAADGYHCAKLIIKH